MLPFPYTLYRLLPLLFPPTTCLPLLHSLPSYGTFTLPTHSILSSGPPSFHPPPCLTSPSLLGFQRGYIQPVVRIRIRAYDVERKKIYNRKFRYTNFPKLKNVQVSGFGSGIKVIQQEILSSDMIFSMLKETITAYNKKYLNQE